MELPKRRVVILEHLTIEHVQRNSGIECNAPWLEGIEDILVSRLNNVTNTGRVKSILEITN
jgi:hypothetical protein